MSFDKDDSYRDALERATDAEMDLAWFLQNVAFTGNGALKAAEHRKDNAPLYRYLAQAQNILSSTINRDMAREILAAA